MIRLKTRNKQNRFGGVFDAYLSKVDSTLEPAIRALVAVTASNIIRDTKVDMRRPKSGRVYSYKGARHQASAPGETPAVRSGALFRSLNRKLFNAPGGSIGIVTTDIPYAKYLIRNDRPIFNPAFDVHKLIFVRELKNTIRKFSGATV